MLYAYGEYFGDITGFIEPETGYYNWLVGKLKDGTWVPPFDAYKIRIASVDGSDMSDGYFTMYEGAAIAASSRKKSAPGSPADKSKKNND